MDIGKLYNKYNFKQPGLPPGAACRDVAHVPVRQERRRVLFDHNDANSFNSVQNIIPLAPVLRGPATNRSYSQNATHSSTCNLLLTITIVSSDSANTGARM